MPSERDVEIYFFDKLQSLLNLISDEIKGLNELISSCNEFIERLITANYSIDPDVLKRLKYVGIVTDEVPVLITILGTREKELSVVLMPKGTRFEVVFKTRGYVGSYEVHPYIRFIGETPLYPYVLSSFPPLITHSSAYTSLGIAKRVYKGLGTVMGRLVKHKFRMVTPISDTARKMFGDMIYDLYPRYTEEAPYNLVDYRKYVNISDKIFIDFNFSIRLGSMYSILITTPSKYGEVAVYERYSYGELLEHLDAILSVFSYYYAVSSVCSSRYLEKRK